MIRGSSKEPDVGAIVNAVHWLPYQADCRAWFECKEVALKTLDLEEKRSEAEERRTLEDRRVFNANVSLLPSESPPFEGSLKCSLLIAGLPVRRHRFQVKSSSEVIPKNHSVL